MAYAGAEFAEKILRAINGEKGIVAPTYIALSAEAGGADVQKEIGKDVEYFSVKTELGVSFVLCNLSA